MSVSVITPTYNSAETVWALYTSLACQSRPPDEWVVVDDASADGTREVIDACRRDARFPVAYLQHARNRGAAAARNTGIAAASSDYLAFVDADDRLDADHLAEQLRTAAGEDVVVISPLRYLIGTDRVEEGRCSRLPDAGVSRAGLLRHLLLRPSFAHCSCLFPARVIGELGGYDPALETDEDGWLLYQVLSGATPYRFCPGTHYNYSLWQEGASSLSEDVSPAKLRSRTEVAERILADAAACGDAFALTGAIAHRLNAIGFEAGARHPALSRAAFARADALGAGVPPSPLAPFAALRRRLGWRAAVSAYANYQRLRRFAAHYRN